MAGGSPGVASAATPPVDYQREVAPILAEHCLRCHGVDEQDRQGGLRLDSLESMLRGGESGGPAIFPGNITQGELLARIRSTDDDLVMPPPGENKRLSAEQIAILERWVEQGAKVTTHWAFVPPQKSVLPAEGPAHPVDAWVFAKLRTRGLPSAAPAAPHALCRRLYLDLIGLPPTPAELADFEREGWEATVEKLLASERFGERWARLWLDAARYSDTNGYEKDLRRDQWAWRDWVVRSLNRDLPYNDFIIEQIAGDLLPNASQDQLVATGFLRNSMLNEEGAIVPEQFRMVEMFDRMDCVGKSILGLTTQCAQCHSHKYDPLTHQEYYGLFAFLNNSYEAQSHVYDESQQAARTRGEAAIQSLEDQLRQQRPEWRSELNRWVSQVQQAQASWTPLKATELDSEGGGCHPVQLSDLSVLSLGHTSGNIFLVAEPELRGVTGIRLEVLTHGDLPFGGPGRNRATGGWQANELEVSIQRPGAKDWERLKLVNATADHGQPESRQADGKTASGPVAFLVDGVAETMWQADRGRGRRNQPSVAAAQFEAPLELPAGTRMKIVLRMGDMVGCCRFSLTTSVQPRVPAVDYAALQAMEVADDQRSDAENAALFAAWRRSQSDLQSWTDRVDAAWQEYPEAMTSVLHLAERSAAHARETHRLDRGEWDRPLELVERQTPAALHSWEEGQPRDRLAFARWLVSPRSPLAARVAVNRLWQTLFGEGLVETSEDFGTRAPVPEHLELLDWLAVDMMEHGWSQKHVIRTIVTSATYQQSSNFTPESLELDPRNRWLTRGPRFRADAEVIRDLALSVSGLLSHRLGGPPVIPPVPQNVLDYNYVYPSYWTPAQGADRYRRTLYGFRKRSMPDPVMSNFDAPNGDTACVRRVRSNTPLAALTSLNEPIFFEAAQALALRVLREGGARDDERAAYAFRLCTSRTPTEAESRELLALLQSRRARISDGWLNVRAITTGDATRLPELPPGSTPQDAAAWTLVARVLLNLDETLTKN